MAAGLGVALSYLPPRQACYRSSRARGAFGSRLAQVVVSVLGYFMLLGGLVLSGSTGGPLVGGPTPDLALRLILRLGMGGLGPSTALVDDLVG